MLVGGTAWVFSKPEAVDRYDYSFIDEWGSTGLSQAAPRSGFRSQEPATKSGRHSLQRDNLTLPDR